ncbi:MAG: universal stress protein [Pyrinomonadaceae bacterium]
MRVLLAIDDSEFSNEAIRCCGDLIGNGADNEVLIVSSMERMFMPTEPFAVSAEYVEKIDNATEATTQAVINRAATRLSLMYPELAPFVSTSLIVGAPEKAIVEEAANWNADLIIMGSHGYGFWQRAVLGSVSDAVIHHSPCSVMVVRPAARKRIGGY